MGMKPPRVFLLGLDGATWRVLDKLIAAGKMPNLAKLADKGTKGALRSTIPYITPVAWSSMISGVKPSKHGIFGYLVTENRDGVILTSLSNRAKIRVPTVFDIYHQVGKKVISVNMPMTYPPRPEDGTIITGMMTPSWESKFYSPQDLLDELASHGIDYRIDIRFGRERGENFDERIKAFLSDHAAPLLKDLRHVTEERKKTVLHLIANKEWDLFMVNFVSMDRIQHYLWDLFEREDGDPELRRRIYDYYEYLDSVVGEIHSAIGDESILLICSDHGFGKCKGNFYLDVWLEKMGYLVRKDSGLGITGLAKKILRSLRINKLLLRFLERSKKSVAKKLIFIGTSKIDWDSTRAYVYSQDGIRINLKGRDPYGIVEPGEEYENLRQEIERGLLQIKTEDGGQLMAKVHMAEDLYGTPNMADAPDIVYEFTDAYHCSTYDGGAGSSRILDRGYSWRQGDHRRDGVVLIAGKDVKAGKTVRADIEDILPTILFVQGLPLSEIFDGRVISEAFTESFVSGRESQQKRLFERGDIEAPEADKDDEVMDRLKGLGYI
jgi:predicted AlkP superfamily phosphohydrolase/phosphomutase